MLEPVKGCGRRSLKVELKGHFEWPCFPVLISSSSHIPEGKNMPFLKHGMPDRRPCVWCMVMLENVRSLSTRGSRL